MRAKGRRGSVLVQVLVAAVFMAIISASILRMRLQPATNTAGSVARVAEDLAARAALNRLTESWARLGTCASDAAARVACSGVGCDCRCVVDSVVVTAVPQGGACFLRLVSPQQ